MSLLAAASNTAILGRPYDRSSVQRPVTMTGWMRFDATPPTIFHIGLSHLSGGSQYAALLWFANQSGLSAVADERDSAATEAYTFADYGDISQPVQAGLWYFGAAIYREESYRSALVTRYGDLNSPGDSADATSTLLASPFTHVTVGSVQPSVGNLDSNAGTYLAECALWDCELGLYDMLELAQGRSPLRVGARDALCHYFPLRGDLRDYGNTGVGLRDVGTTPYSITYADHPPIDNAPRRLYYGKFVAPVVQTRRTIISYVC